MQNAVVMWNSFLVACAITVAGCGGDDSGGPSGTSKNDPTSVLKGIGRGDKGEVASLDATDGGAAIGGGQSDGGAPPDDGDETGGSNAQAGAGGDEAGAGAAGASGEAGMGGTAGGAGPDAGSSTTLTRDMFIGTWAKERVMVACDVEVTEDTPIECPQCSTSETILDDYTTPVSWPLDPTWDGDVLVQSRFEYTASLFDMFKIERRLWLIDENTVLGREFWPRNTVSLEPWCFAIRMTRQ